MNYCPRIPIAIATGLAAVSIGALSTPTHAQTKMVFAHYMVTNQDYAANTSDSTKVQGYEKEIQQAQAEGINGFALNCGGWLNQTYYITYATQMFEAAAALNSGFKLFFSCDFCCGNGVNDAEDMMRRFCNNSTYAPYYFTYNGKYVLSTFAGDTQIGMSGFAKIRRDLANGSNPITPPSGFAASSTSPLQVCIVPAFFWGGDLPTQSQIQSGFSADSSYIDGNFYWGIAGVPGSGGSQDQIPCSENYASIDHSGGKLYMAPVSLQFWGADNLNEYFEYSGFSGMRKMWMDAINTSHPDWVEIITWNDFIEGTYISPIDDPDKYPNANYLTGSGIQTWGSSQGPPLGYWHSHYAAADLSSYFISWYKNGSAPALTKDTIYWAYRTVPMSVNAGSPNIGTEYGPVGDNIYITCNLTAAATLTVNSAGKVTTINVPAGSNDVTAPFIAGSAPTFTLTRNGSTLISATGADAIKNPPVFNDYTSGTSTLNDWYYSTGDASDSGGGGTTGVAPSNGIHTLTPGCATGSRLDDNAAGTTNGNKIQIYQANGSAAQQWNFALLSGTTNNWNLAVNLGPYCLDGGAAKSGTAVQLWSCNGTADQDWVSGAAAQSGAYNFASKQSGLCLDVAGAASANGTAVQSYTCNGTSAQAWYIN